MLFLLSFADSIFYFQNKLLKKYFRKTISVSNVLDPNQGRSVRKLFVKGYQQMTNVAASKEGARAFPGRLYLAAMRYKQFRVLTTT